MSLLNTVVRGKKIKPLALMLHAPHGIGKSTFASEAPNPIYIGEEENDELSIARFPKLQKWSDFEAQLKTLLEEDHNYKTLVIDTLDGIERLAEIEILLHKDAKGKSMATAYGGYGKSYSIMKNMFLMVRNNYIIPLRDKKGMNIVLLVHSAKKTHEDPMLNISYNLYETNLHNSTKSIFEDWVSAIFFANNLNLTAKNSDGKEYAESADVRMIYTQKKPSHTAKNRFNLPSEIDFNVTGTWERVKNLILKHYQEDSTPDDVSELKMKVKNLIEKTPDDLQPNLESSLKKCGNDIEKLNELTTKIENILR